MRKKAQEDLPGVNMTAMIDIVFMMVVFFIFSVKMEEQSLSEGIQMALAPHGKIIEKRDPRTVTVDVDAEGHIIINRTILSPDIFKGIMAKAVAEYGSEVPVVIVADAKTQHKFVRKVMDACSGVGLWRIKFMALKEKGEVAQTGALGLETPQAMKSGSR